MLDQRMEQFEEEKKKWEAQRQAAQAEGKEFDDAEPTMNEERERAWQVRECSDVAAGQNVFFTRGCFLLVNTSVARALPRVLRPSFRRVRLVF